MERSHHIGHNGSAMTFSNNNNVSIWDINSALCKPTSTWILQFQLTWVFSLVWYVKVNVYLLGLHVHPPVPLLWHPSVHAESFFNPIRTSQQFILMILHPSFLHEIFLINPELKYFVIMFLHFLFTWNPVLIHLALKPFILPFMWNPFSIHPVQKLRFILPFTTLWGIILNPSHDIVVHHHVLTSFYSHEILN